MIDELKRLYKNHMITNPSETPTPQRYIWFRTADGPAGFLESELSEKERTLLELFFSPFFPDSGLSREQAFWHALLFAGDKGDDPPPSSLTPFRLIHFYVKDPAIDADSFCEAVDGIFPQEPIVLWETGQEGVIVKPENDSEETVGYEDLVDAVAGDFYTDLLLYVGAKQSSLEDAPVQFRQEKSYFRVSRMNAPTKSVFYHNAQIAFLLLHHSPETVREELFHHLLSPVENDKELLNSIYQYLACDMNVTNAAKKLFIHRNSLQYRVDKFAEKTGMDVKSFEQAVTVYLALLHKRL